jgi:hypothetical protein
MSEADEEITVSMTRVLAALLALALAAGCHHSSVSRQDILTDLNAGFGRCVLRSQDQVNCRGIYNVYLRGVAECLQKNSTNVCLKRVHDVSHGVW